MRIIQKTSYDQDIRIFPDFRDALPYLFLMGALAIAPFVLNTFYIKELAYILILSIAGIGLMLLVGYTGMISLGHGAILGLGAYLHTFFLVKGLHVSVSLVLTVFITAGVSALIAAPALRLSGMYLAIATLAISMLFEEVFTQWDSFTGGIQGVAVPQVTLGGIPLLDPVVFYFICLAFAVLSFLVAKNLLRTRTGRAWIALRDSEVAAKSMGISATRYKITAFAISSGFTGLAGALMAHYMGFLSPDSFNYLLSIQLLILIVVGGVGTLQGAALGAIFVGMLPLLTAWIKDHFPGGFGAMPSFQTVLFGVILVAVIIWEPRGLYGRWLKVKYFFEVFPTYRKATYSRQKTFMKSERVR
ncbi:MAG: branched-chain amino acid ABC transporter permease [Pseudomonadota bacterium]